MPENNDTTAYQRRFVRGAVLVAFLATALLTLPHFQAFLSGEQKGASLAEEAVAGAQKGNPFESVFIEAEGVFVYDTTTREVLFAKKPELQFPLASVTKVMTALVAREIAMGKHVVVTPESLAPEGDSGLLVGEEWGIKDLTDFTLTSSSNDGARALASVGSLTHKEDGYDAGEYFVSLMNKKAREIGMTQTFYVNESGLDVSDGVAGAYGSAKDMALLFTHVLNVAPDLMEATSYETIRVSSNQSVHSAKNTNTVTATIPGLLASKTGFTDLAGGNLVIAFDAGPMHPIVIAVLGSSVDGRFDDVKKLVEASLQVIQQ